jgi:hypothetical protein
MGTCNHSEVHSLHTHILGSIGVQHNRNWTILTGKQQASQSNAAGITNNQATLKLSVRATKLPPPKHNMVAASTPCGQLQASTPSSNHYHPQ